MPTKPKRTKPRHVGIGGVSLPQPVFDKLAAYAFKRSVSRSWVIRQALERYFSQGPADDDFIKQGG